MSPSRLPLAPCPGSWEAMAGDERTRFCEGCGRHVHNLSAMGRDEAERLVCEAAGRLCVRFERTAEGAVKTLELAYRTPPAGAAGGRRGWRFWAGLGATLAAAVGAVNTYVSGSPFRMRAPAPPQMLMGALVLPLPPNPGPVDDAGAE